MSEIIGLSVCGLDKNLSFNYLIFRFKDSCDILKSSGVIKWKQIFTNSVYEQVRNHHSWGLATPRNIST